MCADNLSLQNRQKKKEEAEDKTVMGRDTKSKEGGGKGGRSRKEGVQHKKSEKGKRKKKKAREKG